MADLVIRNGLVVDGTGGPSRLADVAIEGDRIVGRRASLRGAGAPHGRRRGPRASRPASSTSTPTSTPSWPGTRCRTSSCWHGVTSVVLGNCGVTFAPVRPGRPRVPGRDDGERRGHPPRRHPRRPAVGLGRPTASTSAWLDRIAKGLNVGGMVGHCAVRDRGDGRAQPRRGAGLGRRHRDHGRARRRGDRRRRARLLDLAHAAAPCAPTAARCRARSPRPTSCSPSATSSAARAGACSRARAASASSDADELVEHPGRGGVDGRGVAPLRPAGHVRAGAVATAGRTCTAGSSTSPRRRTRSARRVRPQTTARGVGVLFGLAEPHAVRPQSPAWRAAARSVARRASSLSWPTRRGARRLVAEAERRRRPPRSVDAVRAATGPGPLRLRSPTTPRRPTPTARGVTPVEAFIDLNLEPDGEVVCNCPFLNQELSAPWRRCSTIRS